MSRHLFTCIVLLAVAGSSGVASAESRSDPCSKVSRGKRQLGLAPVSRARREELRKIILRNFLSRARRLRGRLISTARTLRGRTYRGRRVRRFGQARIGGAVVEAAVARIEIEAKSYHPDFRHRISEDNDGFSRDELWVFWGTKTTRIRIGRPGESGETGHAHAFVCEPQALCALIWKTGQGGAYTGAVRIARFDATGKVQTVGRLPKSIARRIENDGDVVWTVLPGRCGRRYCLCLTGKGQNRRRRYRFELTAKGFRRWPPVPR